MDDYTYINSSPGTGVANAATGTIPAPNKGTLTYINCGFVPDSVCIMSYATDGSFIRLGTYDLDIDSTYTFGTCAYSPSTITPLKKEMIKFVVDSSGNIMDPSSNAPWKSYVARPHPAYDSSGNRTNGFVITTRSANTDFGSTVYWSAIKRS